MMPKYPTHLLLRFSETSLKDGDTIAAHNKIASQHGAIWFGKMCLPVSQNHIDRLNEQVQFCIQTLAKNVDVFYAEVISFAQSLTEEEQGSVAEQLSEKELAILDLLNKPEPKLSRKDMENVKAVAQNLLDTLKTERLMLDRRKHQQTKAGVKVTIRDTLDKLPDAYHDGLFHQKCHMVFQHMYDSYFGAGRSIYGMER